MGNWLFRDLVEPCGKTVECNSFSGMEEAFLRFPHIPEQIMEELDFKSLTNARLVAKSWKGFIDVREHQWYPFKNEIADLKKKCLDGNTPFHMACQNGQTKFAKIIMKSSAKLNVDLNAKNKDGDTAFHRACWIRHSKLAEIIMKNSTEINIELNSKNNAGCTAFHFACMHGITSIVDMMINNSESLKLDLAARTNSGKTGFQLAQDCDRTDVVNLIRSKMPRIAM